MFERFSLKIIYIKTLAIFQILKNKKHPIFVSLKQKQTMRYLLHIPNGMCTVYTFDKCNKIIIKRAPFTMIPSIIICYPIRVQPLFYYSM